MSRRPPRSSFSHDLRSSVRRLLAKVFRERENVKRIIGPCYEIRTRLATITLTPPSEMRLRNIFRDSDIAVQAELLIRHLDLEPDRSAGQLHGEALPQL